MALVLEKGDVLLGAGPLQPGEPVHHRLRFLATQLLAIVSAGQALKRTKAARGPQQFGEVHRQSDPCSACTLLEKCLQCAGRVLNDRVVEAGDLRVDDDRLSCDSAIVKFHPFPKGWLGLLALEGLRWKLFGESVGQQLIGLRGIRHHQIRTQIRAIAALELLPEIGAFVQRDLHFHVGFDLAEIADDQLNPAAEVGLCCGVDRAVLVDHHRQVEHHRQLVAEAAATAEQQGGENDAGCQPSTHDAEAIHQSILNFKFTAVLPWPSGCLRRGSDVQLFCEHGPLKLRASRVRTGQDL